MENRLCSLDKQPGVHPLGIGCIIRRLITKCALKAGGADAKAACGSKQLCAGLKAVIEGVIHAVMEKIEENVEMEFGEWEINDKVWLKGVGKDKVQESVLERRYRKARRGPADPA